MRPRQPRSLMRLPLRGHAVAQFARRPGSSAPSAVIVTSSSPPSSRACPAIDKPPRNRPVRIDAPVAQEWPVAARILHQLQIHLANQNLLRSCAAFATTRPNGSAMKLPPQNSSPGPSARLPSTSPCSMAHAVHRGHVNAVGNGVRALDRLPRLILRRAKLAPSPPDATRSPSG